MLLRVAFAAFLVAVCTSTTQVLAQFTPPGPPTLLPPPFRPLPPAAVADDDLPPYDPPPVYSRRGPAPLDPVTRETLPPPGPYGHAEPDYPPPAVEPGYGVDPRPAPRPQPQYGGQAPQRDQALRPPAPIGPPLPLPLLVPGQPPQPVPAQPQPNQPAHAPAAPGQADQDITASHLPPDIRPETGPAKELPPQFRRTMVDYRTREPAGTIIIDTANTYLYLVLGNGKALRYGIGVGREGFTWSGAERITRMAEWPDWHPPAEMIERQPYLPRFMAGGPGNPLGARALYLGKTLYRIHGTNQPSTIGTFVSSGCIRLTNEDIIDLYYRVKVGTRVVVLPGKPPPATASAAPQYSPAGAQGQANVPLADPIPLNPPSVIRAQ